MRRPSSTLVPARRTTIGILISSSFMASTTPFATQSQRLMPANTLTRIALTCLSRSTDASGLTMISANSLAEAAQKVVAAAKNSRAVGHVAFRRGG